MTIAFRNRTAPSSTGENKDVDLQRMLSDYARLPRDLESAFLSIPRIAPPTTVPVSGGLPTAFKFSEHNRISINSNGAVLLPRVRGADIGKPLWIEVTGSLGRATLIPPESFTQAGTVTIDGQPSKGITVIGLYLLVHDGRNWYAMCGSGQNVYVPTGERDEGAAFQRAILRAAATTGHLMVTAGTIRLTTAEIRLFSNLWLDMAPGTILDFSSAGSADCLIADGSEASTMTLTANAAKGATAITLSAPNAATLAQGDWIRVASTTVFDASDTNSEIGEIVKVKSVSGVTVTLETPLRGGSYTTAASAVASKITFVENIRVTGGKILGGGTLTAAGSDADCNGIRIFLGFRCFVEGVSFQRCDLASVWLQDCLYSQVRTSHFQDAVNDAQGYGVLFDNACQDCAIVDCTSDRVRHCVTLGNSTNTKGVTRRIRYSGLQIYSTTPARGGTGGDAIDTHAAAEDITIDCCSVYSSSGGGINVECASVAISNCQIFNTTDYGIIYHNESDQNGNVSITNCRVVNAGLSGSWEGIRVNNPARGGGANVAFNTSVNVCGNQVINPTGIGIYVVNSVGASATIQRNGSVVGNTVIGSGSASASIYLEDCTNFTVCGNTVADPTSSTQQLIQLRDCSNMAVSGNSLKHITSSSGIGIYVNASGSGSCRHVSITGNSIHCDTPVNLRGAYLDDNAQNCVVAYNQFQKCNEEVRRGTGSGHDVPSDVLLTTTIASGVITVNRNSREVVIDTEGAAATDDLDTINGGVPGQIICLRSANTARDPRIRHATGNVLCGADFTLLTSNDLMTLEFCSSNSWRRIASATN